MLLSQLLFLGVYAILVVATDGLLPSANVLNDAQGQNPCEMQKTFQDGCPTSRRDTNSTQITSCTCTNVYFNLWSACVFIQNHLDNTTLPPCEDFLQNCTNSAIRVTNWTDDPSKGYPRWVYMALPSNGQTFDIAAAIESATPPSHKWTIVQIVLPIIVGLAVAAAILVVFVCYRRRKRSSRNRPWMQTTGNRARFHFPALTNIVKVRELNRSTSWSIDEREEPMDEYQFVSAPNSIQGSQASGHVRLSSSSSGTHPPPLAITTGQAVPARAWPGRSLWIGPYSRAKRLFDTVPLPWRSAKRVHVKNMGSYNKFRVDSDDSDSPLSQRTHESIMAAAGRSQSNLRNETLFEPEEDSDSETEGLPLMSHEQGRRAHGAENLAPRPDAFSPQGANPLRSPRQIPPTSAPPRIPLPLPPPKPFQQPITSPPPPSASRSNRSAPAFPPAPTSPPPPPPTISRSSPRAARGVLPSASENPPPIPRSRMNAPPPLPLTSPPISQPLAANEPSGTPPGRTHQRSDSSSVRSLPTMPRQPHARTNSDSSSIRSLPMTPTPPYVRGATQQQQTVLVPTAASDSGATPPNSAPPYVQRPSLDFSHSSQVPSRPPPSNNTMRRLPQPPS